MNRRWLQSLVRHAERQAGKGPAPIPDGELLARFSMKRDEAAFSALVGRHAPLVWSVCRHLLADSEDAEDAFQATFLALLESAAKLKKPGSLGAWLHGTAYRIAMKARRTAARRTRRERAAAAPEAASPVPGAAWNELQLAVHEEVCRLPVTLRQAFIACSLEGKSQQEAAQELGWKVGTLSGRLTRARQQLMERLSKREVTAGVTVLAVLGGASAIHAAVPLNLLDRSASLARLGLDYTVSTSTTVLELARGATEVSMTRFKLMTAAVLLLGILGTGLGFRFLPDGTAQGPPTSPAPGGGPTGELPNRYFPGQSSLFEAVDPAASAKYTAAPWEYKYVPRTSDKLEDFQKTLSQYATDGWEYCGTESLTPTDAKNKAQWGTAPTLVFKRPGTRSRGGISGFGGGPGAGGFGLARGGQSTPAPSTTPPAATTPAPAPGTPFGPGGGLPGGGMFGGPPTRSSQDVTIVRLKYAVGAELAQTLQSLFNNARVVAEAQTNSLLIVADKEMAAKISALVEKLDVASERKPR